MICVDAIEIAKDHPRLIHYSRDPGEVVPKLPPSAKVRTSINRRDQPGYVPFLVNSSVYKLITRFQNLHFPSAASHKHQIPPDCPLESTMNIPDNLVS